MRHLKNAYVWTILLILLIISSGFFYTLFSCVAVPEQAQETGTHGWRVWENESFVSFIPQPNKRYCIPSGWESIGAEVDRLGNATFPAAASGIILRSSDFITTHVPIDELGTNINVVYPAQTPDTDVVEYMEIITNAFANVRTLYPNFQTTNLASHTVLITIGIAGDGNDFKTSVYPNPNQHVTVFVRNKNHRRGEALFVHAVAHLFNRHYTEGLAYQENQAPIPTQDWQEVEAAWTEIIFQSDKRLRAERVEQLYGIHKSIVTDVFSVSLEFPFNDKNVYEDVRRKSIILGADPTYGEEQYSHYILAPLLLLAIEGLLAEHSPETSVSALLTQAHQNNQNFFVLASDHLPKETMPTIGNYIFGKELIPYELLVAGLRRYENQ
jgi:hypothetical protein